MTPPVLNVLNVINPVWEKGPEFRPTKFVRLPAKDILPLVAQVLSVTRTMRLSQDVAGSSSCSVFLSPSLRRRQYDIVAERTYRRRAAIRPQLSGCLIRPSYYSIRLS